MHGRSTEDQLDAVGCESNLAGRKILCENNTNLIRGEDTPHLYRSPKKRGGIKSVGPRCGSVETCRNGNSMNTAVPETDGNEGCVRQSRNEYGKGFTQAHQENL